jgi:glycosyltransferase involved in cell wall biosynthesis
MVDAPYAGGAEVYVGLLATHLPRDRFEARVVVKAEARLEDWVGELRRSGVPVYEVPMDLPYAPHHAPKIWRVLARLRPHVAHVNLPGPYDGQMALLVPLARLAGASRVVVTEHLPMVERLWKRAALKSLAYRWLDWAFTVCRANLPYLVERQGVPADRVSAVPNGLPRAFGTRYRGERERVRSELALKPEETAVVVVGSLIPRKGQDTLLRAMAKLERSDWRLFVVGEGSERVRYEALARSLGLTHRVRFLGQKSREKVEELLAGMDLLVIPSSMEAMPYVLLEGMAAGLPVVASAIFGIPEVVVPGETGWLFPKGDENALASQLREALDAPERRRAMGEAARRRFEKYFTLERQVEVIACHYERLLREGRPRVGPT